MKIEEQCMEKKKKSDTNWKQVCTFSMKEKQNTKTNKQQKQKQRDDKQLFPGARFRLKKNSGFLLITQVFCFSIGAVQRIL